MKINEFTMKINENPILWINLEFPRSLFSYVKQMKINENQWKSYCHRSRIRPRPRPTPAQASHLKFSPKWPASSSTLKIDAFTFAFARFWLVRVGGVQDWVPRACPGSGLGQSRPGQSQARPRAGQAGQVQTQAQVQKVASEVHLHTIGS